MSDIGSSQNNSYEGYEKLKTVGKGAFGTATLYKRLSDNMHVVMKEVFLSDMSKEEKKLALNEVDVLSLLKHPNIIRYMGSFEKEGSLIIIMEYANGGNLAQLISSKKSQMASFTENSVLQIIYQISGALSYMHANKILHRDLKTANIFLNKNGTIKVGDFGISKVLSTKSQAQTIIGTPYYLSPEMCEGKDYNEKSDIWAFGCILYELVSLKRPFEAPTLPILVNKITMCEYEDIPRHYSEGLNQLVHMILQKNWDQRPTAKDIHTIILPDISRNAEILNDINLLLSHNIDEKYQAERSLLYRISLSNGISTPVPYELPNKKIIHVACSKNHYIAVAADNTVYTWGEDSCGQLAQGKPAVYRKYPICVDYLHGKSIEKCAAGNRYSIFLAKSGLLLSCGDGKNGCLGHGDWNNLLRPKLIDNLITSVITDVVCSADHVLALTVDRKVFTWGLGEDGQLGLGDKKFCCFPSQVTLEEAKFSVERIFTGENASALLSTDGRIMVCGNNSYNKLGLGGKEKVNKFTLVKDLQEKLKHVSLGIHHTAFITETGNIITLGKNCGGQLGKGNCKVYTTPQKVNFFKNDIEMVSCGPTFTIATTSNNVLYLWGTHYKSSSAQRETVMPKEYAMALNSELEQQVPRNPETVLKPKSILALYSSPENVDNNNVVIMGNLQAQESGILILVHTTTQPPTNSFQKNGSSGYQSNFTVPTWKNSQAVTTGNTTLPNTPHMN